MVSVGDCETVPQNKGDDVYSITLNIKGSRVSTVPVKLETLLPSSSQRDAFLVQESARPIEEMACVVLPFGTPCKLDRILPASGFQSSFFDTYSTVWRKELPASTFVGLVTFPGASEARPIPGALLHAVHPQALIEGRQDRFGAAFLKTMRAELDSILDGVATVVQVETKKSIKGLFPEEECSLRRYLRGSFAAAVGSTDEAKTGGAGTESAGAVSSAKQSTDDEETKPAARPPPIVPSFTATRRVRPAGSTQAKLLKQSKTSGMTPSLRSAAASKASKKRNRSSSGGGASSARSKGTGAGDDAHPQATKKAKASRPSKAKAKAKAKSGRASTSAKTSLDDTSSSSEAKGDAAVCTNKDSKRLDGEGALKKHKRPKGDKKKDAQKDSSEKESSTAANRESDSTGASTKHGNEAKAKECADGQPAEDCPSKSGAKAKKSKKAAASRAASKRQATPRASKNARDGGKGQPKQGASAAGDNAKRSGTEREKGEGRPPPSKVAKSLLASLNAVEEEQEHSGQHSSGGMEVDKVATQQESGQKEAQEKPSGKKKGTGTARKRKDVATKRQEAEAKLASLDMKKVADTDAWATLNTSMLRLWLTKQGVKVTTKTKKDALVEKVKAALSAA